MPATRDWFTSPTSGPESDEALAIALSNFPEARRLAESEAKSLGLDPNLLFPKGETVDEQIQRLKAADPLAWQALFSRTLPVLDTVCEIRAISDHERKYETASLVFSKLPDLVARSSSRQELLFLVWTCANYSATTRSSLCVANWLLKFQEPMDKSYKEFEKVLYDLSEPKRKVFEKYSFECKTTREIASELNTTRETVTKLLAQAMSHVGKKMITAA
jgi:hypothetical protein